MCDECFATTDKWKLKAQLLQKMYSDLNAVMRKYISDGREHPVLSKVVRSVGLQVTKVKTKQIYQGKNRNLTR